MKDNRFTERSSKHGQRLVFNHRPVCTFVGKERATAQEARDQSRTIGLGVDPVRPGLGEFCRDTSEGDRGNGRIGRTVDLQITAPIVLESGFPPIADQLDAFTRVANVTFNNRRVVSACRQIDPMLVIVTMNFRSRCGLRQTRCGKTASKDRCKAKCGAAQAASAR